MGPNKITPNYPNKKNATLVYPELSYLIVGMLFDVHMRLGGSFQEKHYQRAVEKLFLKQNIKYVKELKVPVSFEGEKIANFFLDFLIEDKVILELKAVPKFLPIHFRQVRTYLKTKKLELGILANFRGEKLTYQRILNRPN